MECKTEVKEETVVSSIDLQNEEGFPFSCGVTTVNQTATYDGESRREIEREVKENSVVSNPELQNQQTYSSVDLSVNINNTALYSNYKMENKIEVKEEPHDSDIALQNEGDVTKIKHCRDVSEMNTKTEIKEEPVWVEAKSLEVIPQLEVSPIPCNQVESELKDGVVTEFLSSEPQRLCTEVASSINKSTPAVLTTEELELTEMFEMRNNSFQSRETSMHKVHRNSVTETLGIEQNIQLNCVSGKTRHKCVICEKDFASKTILKHHILIHEGKEPYKCEVCKKRFAGKSSLKNHILAHGRPFKCGICEKSFTQKRSLKIHVLVHEGLRPFKCNICDKSYSAKSSLRYHKMTHEGKRPFKCEICKKCFTQKATLQSHMLIHEGKRPYKCVICEKTFIQSSGLKVHMEIHEGKKLRFKCNMCEKRFNVKNSLKSHILVHEGKKPHKCDVCGKNFTLKRSLKRHLEIHDRTKIYRCEKCEKSYKCKKSLEAHMLNYKHNTCKYQCTSCFNEKGKLNPLEQRTIQL